MRSFTQIDIFSAWLLPDVPFAGDALQRPGDRGGGVTYINLVKSKKTKMIKIPMMAGARLSLKPTKPAPQTLVACVFVARCTFLPAAAPARVSYA
jgi:hypothetical protein